MKTQLGILTSIALALAGCSKQAGESKAAAAAAAAKAAEPVAIRMAAAEVRKVEKTISVTGSLLPDETVSVSAEVPGRVVAIRADFGQRVKKGDVLAEIDTQELALQRERAKASLAQALARAGLRPGQEDATPETTPSIRQAAAQFEDARSKYDNAAKLVKSGDIAQERFNEIDKALQARQAALEATRDELRVLLASIQALRAEVRLSEKRLNDAVVRAPFDGAVTARLISPGQYTKENTPILTLVKTNPLRLRADIPESIAMDVRVGTTLSFTTDAAPGVTFHAVVREMNPSLDARSRSLAAEARLLDNDARLKPGMFVQVRLVTARDASVVAVPKEAVYTVAGLTKIFVIRDGKAVEIRLTPGLEVDGWVEAPGGLVRAGELVATSNLAALVNGAPVARKG
ncbi:MAG: efflux RND transporter periplasmic adaptor subunit [Bryobacterales bacterium]|nr:efflux RND transporter periplasmic adaptor subunit [Bryobacterales bacterium]